MSGYLLSTEAEEDVFQIWRYLVEEAGVKIADSYRIQILQSVRVVGENPRLVRFQSERRPLTLLHQG